jgi:steroid delta-isomerase
VPAQVQTTPQQEHRTAVLRYYRAVDRDDIEELLSLFAEGATYYRPGYEPIHGRAGLHRFYSSDRVIVRGEHQVAAVVSDGAWTSVQGKFDGSLRDGSAAHLRFADFFLFDDSGQISERRTFFYTPMV